MSDSIENEGKKNLPLDSLDKIVGGASATRPAQGVMSQQIADALANIDQAKLQAAAEAAKTKPLVVEVDAKTPSTGAPTALSALDQVAKDVAAEIAKEPTGIRYDLLAEKVYALTDPIAKKLGIGQSEAESVGYAMAYKAVFEGGATDKLPTNIANELKSAFFAKGQFGLTPVMERVIQGTAIEAAMNGDLGKFASRTATLMQAEIERRTLVGFSLDNYFISTPRQIEGALRALDKLPGGSALITSPLEASLPGSSGEMLSGLVKCIELEVQAKKLGGDPVPGLISHVEQGLLGMFKPGILVTAEMKQLLTDAASDCQKAFSLRNAPGVTQTNSWREITDHFSKNYVSCMSSNPGAEAREATTKLFLRFLGDFRLDAAQQAGLEQRTQGMLNEVIKAAGHDVPAALIGLTELAKGGSRAALAGLENLATTGVKGALPALDGLARAGTAGSLDTLERLARNSIAGVAGVIEKLTKDQVAGAMPLLEKLVKAKVPGAAGILESLVKQNTPGALASLTAMVRADALPAWDVMSALARAKNPQALALLETLAREARTNAPIYRLADAGAYTEIEKVAKAGVPFAMAAISDWAKMTPAEAYPAIERLARANVPAAIETLTTLARQQWQGSFESLERLAREKVPGAMEALGNMATENAGGSLALVEKLVREGQPVGAELIGTLVFKRVVTLDKVEEWAKTGSRGAFDALGLLADRSWTGALGAVAKVTKFQVDQIHTNIVEGLTKGTAGDITKFMGRQAAQLEQRLGLSSQAALSLVKAETYEIVTETLGLKGPTLAAFGPLTADVASIAQGIGVQTMLMLNDAEKGAKRFADLMAEKTGPLAEAAKGPIVNEGMAALRKGQEMVGDTRVGKAAFALINDPTNEANYKKVIAEGVLFWYGSKKVSDFGKVLGALTGFEHLAQNSAIGKVFDVAGVSDQVRQAAQACGKMADNLKDAFVDCYTEGFLNPVFDIAKNTGKNCYELGKSIASGNPADIGKAMGNLMEGLANDYIGSIKTYYMKGGEAAVRWARTITMDFMNDVGATPYAEKFIDINKEAMVRLGDLAQQGSAQAVRELSSLVHSTGKFAENAAAELLRVADKVVPGPIRDQALRAINDIGRLGGPAKEVLYKVAGTFEDGGNAVAREVVNVYKISTGWAEDAWNASLGRLF